MDDFLTTKNLLDQLPGLIKAEIKAAYFEGYSDRNDCPLLVSDCWKLSKTKAGLDLTDSNIEGSGMVAPI